MVIKNLGELDTLHVKLEQFLKNQGCTITVKPVELDEEGWVETVKETNQFIHTARNSFREVNFLVVDDRCVSAHYGTPDGEGPHQAVFHDEANYDEDGEPLLDTWDEVEGQLRVFLSDWVMHS